MALDLGSMLQQYLGRGANQPVPDAERHYEEVARNAPPELVRDGLSEAFRSEQTPPFGEMVSDLFRKATPEQQSSMMAALLRGLGPAGVAELSKGGGALGGPGQSGGAASATLSPRDVTQYSPEQVRDIAERAEKQDPSIIDQMSSFYAQHGSLVRTLGGAALTVALAKIATSMRR